MNKTIELNPSHKQAIAAAIGFIVVAEKLINEAHLTDDQIRTIKAFITTSLVVLEFVDDEDELTDVDEISDITKSIINKAKGLS